jgi:ABC-type spermidine/putrescine transport system permease subunit II
MRSPASILLLVAVAAPMRRSGAYTLPDFAEARLGSRAIRLVSSLLVVGIGWLYLVPQFQGAGLTLTLVTGAPAWVGGFVVMVVIAVAVGALTLVIATSAAFAISRLRVRGGRTVMNMALFTYFIPAAFLAVPMYRTMGNYGLLNNHWSLILAMVTIASPYAIWVLKQASDIQRTFNVNGGNGVVDRRVYTLDDITHIQVVPSARFKTKFDFTNGCVPATGANAAKNIQYILIDPECQISRVKYSYIRFFTPGTDSRTADKYLYQNRRYNGTFAIDHLMTQGCIIHADA